MECLEYAGNMFREVTGEERPRPSTGMYPGEYWNNASNRTAAVRCPGVAIWVNNNSTNEGHALCVAYYDSSTQRYYCYEANWDGNGNTRRFEKRDYEIQSMYTSKVWKGCVY